MKKRTASLTALATLSIAAALSGCATLTPGNYSHIIEKHFDAVSDMTAYHTDTKDIAFSPKEWVPEDATDITVALVTTAEPGYLITFESSDGFDPAACTPIESAPRPAMKADWWPKKLSGPVSKCGESNMFVTTQKGHVYGWAGAVPKK